MKSVPEALSMILSRAKFMPPEITALTSSALGMTLAADIVADIDSPPFAKSMMDGYAVRAEDCAKPNAELEVVEEIFAGVMPTKSITAGQCSKIYTGAPIPVGADAVVMIEKSESLTQNRVRLNDRDLIPGRNVLARGKEMIAGDVVVPKGTILSPATFGLFATCGKTAVPCIAMPRVAIICTGDEVVEANMKPRGAQIRNSNGPMLVSQTVRAGAMPKYFGISLDTEAMLANVISEGLQTTNVIVLAGGVSAGKLDLVPGVLESMGVTIHFHKVKMKPGKPLLFGTKGDILIFGLPGNPVSSYVGFELFVRPALSQMMGRPHTNLAPLTMTLSEALSTTNDRPTYHPAMIHHHHVKPLPWFGSADLRGLLNANALIALPEGKVDFQSGDIVTVQPIS